MRSSKLLSCFGQHQRSRARCEPEHRGSCGARLGISEVIENPKPSTPSRLSSSFSRRTPEGDGGALPWISRPSKPIVARSITTPAQADGANLIAATHMPCAEEWHGPADSLGFSACTDSRRANRLGSDSSIRPAELSICREKLRNAVGQLKRLDPRTLEQAVCTSHWNRRCAIRRRFFRAHCGPAGRC